MKRFLNILFVAQPDADNRPAFAKAVALASNNQSRLTVLSVVDGPAIDTSSMSHVAQDLRKVMLSARRDELVALISDTTVDGVAIEITVRAGKAFVEIIQDVLRERRDIVITSVGSSDSGKSRLFAGTVMKLLRKCPCPLWLIKSQQEQAFRTILACVDYEPENLELQPLNTQILDMASSLALAHFSNLHVVHAWDTDNEQCLSSARTDNSDADIDALIDEQRTVRTEWLEEVIAECTAMQDQQSADYLGPQAHLIQGKARRVIPEYARTIKADLIVMGTVGRSGIPGFLIGNTAEDILDQIDCSVLAIKPAGFVSPVTLGDSH